MNGIIIINKPKNYTSFDVIAVMRKLLRTKKLGHTGTLDPMATGVLPILIGRATKLQSLIPDNNKEYIASFRLGVTTDTLDITGKIISSSPSNVSKLQLQSVLNNFRGNIKQVPPMFSAVQKDGIRLYSLAQKGIEIERDARNVTIYQLDLICFDEISQEGKILVECSKGTYIRTLCDDIGQLLGCGAVLTDLQRTKACSFDIDNSITLDEARVLSEQNHLDEYILPCDAILKRYNQTFISNLQSTRFKNGGALSLNRIPCPSSVRNDELIRVYDCEKNFLGLGRANKAKHELSVACLIDLPKNM